MGDFFRGWRRQLGLRTLVVACVFMAGWLRSICFNELATFTVHDRIHMVWTDQGGFIWLSYDARGDMTLTWDSNIAKADAYGGGFTRTEAAKAWREHFERLGHHPRVWIANYATIIIPLTLLSAYLILKKPSKTSQQKSTEPTSPEGK